MAGKLIIFSAPSGSGKSTIINYLLQRGVDMKFSISATSRAPRGTEKDGVEYYFLSPDTFRARIAQGDFLEYNEVYEGRFYGTLRSEVEDRLVAGQTVVLDLDVEGGVRVKEIFGERALAVFIQPPSIDALRARLIERATDAPEVIEDRLNRASYEMGFASQFDVVVVNDDLTTAQREAYDIVTSFIAK
ncbi:MAG TPA: guanylate kinase [Bacteroidaceae bacterium]|nr:guanylate kinase [Bacteroidaceae bacterium]